MKWSRSQTLYERHPEWHDCAMNEQQPSPGDQAPAASGGPAPSGPTPKPPLPPNRKSQAFWGGMLAGVAIAIALAVVMHVIQQASPNGGYPACVGTGCPGYSIGGSVAVVLLLGLLIGLGLGTGLAAAVPERTPDFAAPDGS